MLFLKEDLTEAVSCCWSCCCPGQQRPASPADVFQLLDSYLVSSTEPSLNTAACRLLLSIMPGVETAAIFQEKVRGGSERTRIRWTRTCSHPCV